MNSITIKIFTLLIMFVNNAHCSLELVTWGSSDIGGDAYGEFETFISSNVTDIILDRKSVDQFVLEIQKSNGDKTFQSLYSSYSTVFAFTSMQHLARDIRQMSQYYILLNNGELRSSEDYRVVATNVAEIYPAIYDSVVAVTSTGEIRVLGYHSKGVENELSSYQGRFRSVIHTQYTFAAILNDNKTVISWGFGVDSDMVHEFPVKIKTLVATTRKPVSYAALLQDGTVHTWGNGLATDFGEATPYLVNCSKLYSAKDSFAVVRENQTVVSWGANTIHPLDVQSEGEIVEIVSSQNSFAARTVNGSVFAWGPASERQSIIPAELLSSLQQGVVKILSTMYGFAALRNDGKVVSWGTYSFVTTSHYGVADIFASNSAFVALKHDKPVVCWGTSAWDACDGIKGLEEDIVKVVAGYNMFAALSSQGSVTLWPSSKVSLTRSVHLQHIQNVRYASSYVQESWVGFGNDGLVGWGRMIGNIANPVEGNFTQVVTTGMGGFAALHHNGTVYTWGNQAYGGDSSSVSHLLHNVEKLFANSVSIVALRTDATLVAWGLTSGYEPLSVSNGNHDIVDGVAGNIGFSFIRRNGSLLYFGSEQNTNNHEKRKSSTVDLNLNFTKVAAYGDAMAALEDTGTVRVWGKINYGGYPEPHLLQNCTDLHGFLHGFIVEKVDGSLFTFGKFVSVPESVNNAAMQVGVHRLIYLEDDTVAVLYRDGSLKPFGHYKSEPSRYGITEDMLTNVADVYGTHDNVVVKTKDNGIIYWGDYMDEFDQIKSDLQSNVSMIAATDDGVIAVKDDGSFYTWGTLQDVGDNNSRYMEKLKNGKIMSIQANRGSFAALVEVDPTPSPTMTFTYSPTPSPTPLVLNNGAVYSGELSDSNEMHGYGEIRFPNGNVFRGHFQHGLRTHQGKFIRHDNHVQLINWAEPQLATKPGYARSAPDNTTYLGCVADGPKKDLSFLAFTIPKEDMNSETNILADCEAICRQGAFFFFGLQEGSKCFCGNDYGRLEVHPGDPLFRDESECDSPCNGVFIGTAVHCGGNWRNSVFRIGKEPFAFS